MKKLFSILIACSFFASVSAQTDSLFQYTGTYVFPDESVVPTVDVAVADGALTMSSPAGSSPLTQLGVDSFQIVQFSGTAVFKRGDDKSVNAVHIEAMGYILDGVKQKNGIWIFREYYLPANKELRLQIP
jgi:hypothetical protein